MWNIIFRGYIGANYEIQPWWVGEKKELEKKWYWKFWKQKFLVMVKELE